MRKYFALLVMLFVGALTHAQGIEFSDAHYSEAIIEANEADKLVFVDAYAVWCGPCKRMAKNIFPLEEVGDFFNRNFVNLKLDMEKGQGLEFRKTYPVSAFPTFFFIDGSGKVVHKFKGGRDKDGFIREAEKALSKFDNSEKYAKLYEEGNREFETVYKYVKSLNRSGKSSMKIANDYLLSKPELTEEERATFLHEVATETDSRLFGMYIKEMPSIKKVFSAEEIDERIITSAKNTYRKGLSFGSEDLENEALEVVKKHCKNDYKLFEVYMSQEKAMHNKDSELYVKYAKKLNQMSDNEKEKVAIVSNLLTLFKKDAAAMKLAEKVAVDLAKEYPSTTNCLMASDVYTRNQKIDQAKTWAAKAKEAAGSNKRDLANAEKKIKLLETR